MAAANVPVRQGGAARGGGGGGAVPRGGGAAPVPVVVQAEEEVGPWGLGPGMNRAFMNMHLAPNSLYQTFIAKHINAGMYVGTLAVRGVTSGLYVYGIGRSLALRQRYDMSLIATLVGFELCNGFPSADYASIEVAQDMHRAAIQALVFHNFNNGQYVPTPLINIPEEVSALILNNAATVDPFITLMRTVLAANTVTFDQSIEVATGYMSYLTAGIMTSASIICGQLAAFMRRGSVTENWAEKFIHAVQAELGTNIMTSEQLISMAERVWTRIGPILTAETAELIITRWTEIIPATAIRLKATITQARWAGLTTMIAIGRAMDEFSTFPWFNLHIVFEREFTAWERAVRVVGTQAYYGFNNDIENIKAPLYKDLGYIAKELLVRINGEVSLNQFLGWTRRPRYKDQLDLMIATYINNRGRNVFNTDDDGVPLPDAPANSDPIAFAQRLNEWLVNIRGNPVFQS